MISASRRRAAALVALVVLVTPAAVLAHGSPRPPAMEAHLARVIGAGTQLLRVRRPGGGDATEAYVVRVDLRDPHTRAGLLYPSRIAAVQPLTAMAGRAGAFAAVNGDFFNIGASGAPVGPVVGGAQLIKGPERGRELAAGVGEDGVGRIADVFLRGSVKLPDGRRLTLSVLNDASRGPQPMLGPDQVGLFTWRWGGYPLTGAVHGLHSVTQVLVRRGRVVRVRRKAGAGGVPRDGYVLLGVGSGGRALARLHPRQKLVLNYGQGTSAPVPYRFAVGGKYLLLRNGRVQSGLPVTPGKPRTAIGFSHGGHELYLVITLGPQPGVSGLSLPQEAGLLRSLGVRDALALDDGGSTTMVARLRSRGPLRLLNHPADGAERWVANGVGVFHVKRARRDRHGGRW